MNPDPSVRDRSWLPSEGSLLADRYRVGSLLGEGGMAAVVMGEHVHLQERVAIKCLHPRFAEDAEGLARFLREARISSLIKCEHVVRVLDVGTSETGLQFLVMEFLEGTDLGEYVAAHGPMPFQLAVDCVLQVAEALSLAHAAGIVHRDIKPSNLWLSTRHDGTPLVKVLDFGISKLAPGTVADAKLTETSSVFGSPTYMSPEQIRSAKRVDGRADIWALGVVLHELLTGGVPFEGDNVGGILASITADQPVRVSSVRADVPAVLEDVVLACLEKNAARRITLMELAEELRPLASPVGALSAQRVLGAGVKPEGPGWRSKLTPHAPVGASTLSSTTQNVAASRGRSRGLFAGLGAGLLVVAGTSWWLLGRTEPEPWPSGTAASLPLPSQVEPPPSAVLPVVAPPVLVAPVVSSAAVLPVPAPTTHKGGRRPAPVASAAPIAPAASSATKPSAPTPASTISDDRH